MQSWKWLKCDSEGPPHFCSLISIWRLHSFLPTHFFAAFWGMMTGEAELIVMRGDTVLWEHCREGDSWGGTCLGWKEGRKSSLVLKPPWPFLGCGVGGRQSFAKGTIYMLSCEGAHINSVPAQAWYLLQNNSRTYLLYKTKTCHRRAACSLPQWLKALWLFFRAVAFTLRILLCYAVRQLTYSWSPGSPVANEHQAGESPKSWLTLSGLQNSLIYMVLFDLSNNLSDVC